ncbi:hypothetical protein BDZ89DRAFT_421618 [Hymenopellis radicata]|nr:hypothetical protein BDZ89DRAFT_421618 [Hymenopellis radicata]
MSSDYSDTLFTPPPTARRPHDNNDRLEWLEDQFALLVGQVDTLESEKTERRRLEEKNARLSSKISTLEKRLEIEQKKRRSIESAVASLQDVVDQLQKVPSRVKAEPKCEPGLEEYLPLHHLKHREFEDALNGEKSERIEADNVLRRGLEQKVNALRSDLDKMKDRRHFAIPLSTPASPARSITKYNGSHVLSSFEGRPTITPPPSRPGSRKTVSVEIPVHRIPRRRLSVSPLSRRRNLIKPEDESPNEARNTKRKLADPSQRLTPELSDPSQKRIRVESPSSTQATDDGTA